MKLVVSWNFGFMKERDFSDIYYRVMELNRA